MSKRITLVPAAAAFLTGGPARAEGPPARAADRNCSDFRTQRDAQEYFLRRGGPERDPDGLDSDGNGVACESRPCPCSRAKSRRRPRRPSGPRQVIHGRSVEVFDGDTLRVRAFGARRRFYTVRLIGIDAPERWRPDGRSECGSAEATTSLARRAFERLADSDGDGFYDGQGGRGRALTLTTDPSRALFDRHGRLLAYAETAPGVDLGASQVAGGWARVRSGRPFARRRRYERAQARARRASRGVWRACGGDFDRPR